MNYKLQGSSGQLYEDIFAESFFELLN